MTAAVGRLAIRRPPARRLAWLPVVAVPVAAMWWTLAGGAWTRRGVSAVADVMGAALRPDLDPAFLQMALGDVALTLAYAVLSMVLAVTIGVPAGVLASGVIGRWGTWAVVALRAVLGVVRAIHELVWALMLVVTVGLSPVTGVLAIAIPYAAIIGRIVAERISDVDGEPLAAAESVGMGSIGRLLWVRLPETSADLTAYLWYRFECAVRSAAVLSFVGLGGIGLRVETSLDDLAFDRMWTLLYLLVVVVWGVDTISRRARRRLA